MKRLLVIDNYDSFTYNLVHILEDNDEYEIVVKRNDEVDANSAMQFDKIVFSPGPGLPSDAGNMIDIINKVHQSIPILGVCLGHQAITESFGGSLVNLSKVYHGVTGNMTKTEVKCPLLQGISATFSAGRYHSWVADKSSFPKELFVTSEDESGEIMSFMHQELPIYGVQFHPESIMTPIGKIILENFMRL